MKESPKKLTQKIPNAFILKKRIYVTSFRILSSISPVEGILRFLSQLFRKIEAQLDHVVATKNFKLAMRSQNQADHGYAISKYGDMRVAMIYADELNSMNSDRYSGESRKLYQEQLKTLRAIINSSGANSVFNFGVCYAHVDSLLATEYPGKKFTGIDLSPYNCAFNKVEFGSIQNLEIIAGDVFEHLRLNKYDGGIFFHSRTLTLLPRNFIESLYKAVYAANFNYIVCFEQNGLSEETWQPYEFDSLDKPSIYWRNTLYIHNYPQLILAAGFEIQEANLFKTEHPGVDYQILRVIAARKML